jgi:hypothetical protein
MFQLTWDANQTSSPKTQPKAIAKQQSTMSEHQLEHSKQYPVVFCVGPTRYKVSIYLLGVLVYVRMMLSISLDSLPQPEMNMAQGRLFSV